MTVSPDLAVPDREHTREFAALAFEPVFIIGDHRSGTTLLYQLLAATGAFTVLTAYDVIRYDSIVADHLAGHRRAGVQEVAEEFAELGLSSRLIDAVRVTPDLPEEYGFVIGDDSGRPGLTPATVPALVELGQKLRLIGGDRPVLLKNPWDALAFTLVKQALPRARFVFIHRHPLSVMSSQLQAMRSLYTEQNPYLALLSGWYRQVFDRPVELRLSRLVAARRFGIGARVVGRHVTRVADYHLANIDGLAGSDYVELRYEDLCAAPDQILRRVLTFLEVEPDSPVRARDSVRPRAAAIAPEVGRRYARIAPRLAAYRARHGYDLWPPSPQPDPDGQPRRD